MLAASAPDWRSQAKAVAKNRRRHRGIHEETVEDCYLDANDRDLNNSHHPAGMATGRLKYRFTYAFRTIRELLH